MKNISLYIDCKIAGCLKINGIFAGYTDGIIKFSMPLEIPFFIEFFCEDENYENLCLCINDFSVSNKKFFAKTDENSYYLKIIPNKKRNIKFIPHIIACENYQLDGKEYTASFYYDGGYIFSIEDENKNILFAKYYDFEYDKCFFEKQFIYGTYYFAVKQGGKVLLAAHRSVPEQLFFGTGSVSLNEEKIMLLTASENDILRRTKVYEFSKENKVYFKDANIEKINSPNDCVKAFLFAIKECIQRDTILLLADNLKNKLTFENIKEYFGDFFDFCEDFTNSYSKENTLAFFIFKKKESEVILKKYFFETKKDSICYKIINIYD